MDSNNAINPQPEPKIFEWQVGPSKFQAAIAKGARLMSWNIELAQGNQRKILYWPSDADWHQSAKIRGGNPIVFPFVARTFGDGKENFWKHPNGQIYPMPRHGFARDAAFEAIEINPNGFKARLKQEELYSKYYPFDYDFDVEYIFEELGFVVNLTLHNRGTEPLPWTAGHHFYFNLPWHKGLNRQHYKILLEAKKCFYAGKDGSLETLKKPNLTASLDDPAWNDRLHTHLKSPVIEVASQGQFDGVKVIFDKLLPWSTITTWSESPEAPFYCIEPWMGLPNAPTHECGLHWVSPGTSETFQIKIESS